MTPLAENTILVSEVLFQQTVLKKSDSGSCPVEIPSVHSHEQRTRLLSADTSLLFVVADYKLFANSSDVAATYRARREPIEENSSCRVRIEL
ncbi:hypothetical protein NPIL_150621 [Nephila pilipes]|uniref:Uncharacterized protein n=1 Tax=Nephila pilipes TaxID=299642 RepID=A0A8X6NJ25_NEPPI|nr:hypothetical protein NPIL_150621 [Nephila pilipes]